MKNKKIKIAYLLTTFIFLFTYIGGLIGSVESYAYDSTYILLASSSKNSPKSSRKNYSIKPKSTIKPSSGSFSTNSKNNSSNKNTTTIKPDSGSFTTKPNTNYSTNSGSSYGSSSSSGSSSSVKPDSGSFSTKPNTNNKKEETKKENNTNSDYDSGKTYRPYGSWGRRTYIPMYGRGLFGYNPFRGFGYRMGISSMIMDIVMVITILIVAYIIFDMIRSRRNRK